MDNEKTDKIFTDQQRRTLSFIYGHLDSKLLNSVVATPKRVASTYYQTDNYTLQEHHKPISKIIDWNHSNNNG